MRPIACFALAVLLAGCAGRAQETVLLAPCPPAALATCHAQAIGCGAPPFCYRTLGQVDCYPEPEPRRRTIEAVTPPPGGCLIARAG